MGSLYSCIPQDIMLFIISFLNDKSLIKYLAINTDLYHLLIHDNIWKLRIQRRFKDYDIIPDIKLLTQYLQCHCNEIFNRYLTQGITPVMMETAINNINPQSMYDLTRIHGFECNKLLDSFINKYQSINFIKWNNPVMLIVKPQKSVKGKRQEKKYEIISKISYRFNQGRFYRMRYKSAENIDRDTLFTEIMDYLRNGYYIANFDITEAVAQICINKGWAIIKNKESFRKKSRKTILSL